MDSMDFNELFSILQNSDETDRIEAKTASRGIGKSFLETVCALSNEPDLGGGYILLGIMKNDEDSTCRYSITGVDDPDRLQNEIATQCRQCLSIPIRPLLKVISHPQGQILLVYISESNAYEKPVYIKSKGLDGGAYRRIGSSDQICTREDLDLLYQLRSKCKYDDTQVEDASFLDFDPKAIKLYRFEREKIKADAPELRYSDEDLMKALRAIRTEKGVTLPTMAGMLLFGTPMALKRLFPLRNRIDYILVEGREWIADSDHRYTGVEMCESLITGIPRLINQIMIDIPQTFALDDDHLRRKDNPVIPRKVIRESVVNCVMHRDYRVPSPVQIIKYSNRTEFRNSGYSLKPQDQLGLPGSIPRNEIIAEVFHDIHYAEAKGTGIGIMRDEMKKANLSVPLIESDRSSNLFVLTLLPHHLFDKRDIDWLKSFKEYSLNAEEARTLIVIREMGAITNADYRTINSVDTLTSSFHLRRLKGFGLLEQKGGGNATYYVPTKKLLTGGLEPLAPQISSLSGELAPQISSLSGESPPLIDGLLGLTDMVKLKINKLKKRTPSHEIKNLIKELCAVQSLKLSEISTVLGRHPKYIRENYLNDMVNLGELEHVFSDSNHPQQAYRVPQNKDGK